MSWKDHLANVKKHNPEKNLKECMQIASVSYKGANGKSKSTQSSSANMSQNAKSYASTAKDCFADIIGYSKELKTVISQLEKEDVKQIEKCALMLQSIHKSFNQASSSEGSSSEEGSDTGSGSDSD